MNGVCGQSEDYADVALFVPFYPKKERELFSAVEFSLTKIFHSFEENTHYHGWNTTNSLNKSPYFYLPLSRLFLSRFHRSSLQDRAALVFK